MTHEQQMDRVERIARLLAQPDLRGEARTRKQMEMLRSPAEKDRKDDERRAKLKQEQKRSERSDTNDS